MPADVSDLQLASILYYQLFSEEMPVLNYRKQDIEYIIQQLRDKLTDPSKEIWSSNVVH
ncbi:hypothetical protein LS684_19080 [Cytobacillus spongiae]|uniref:hypothetical protein n=1 Tax=Cytobacillus spongiae TaxID=2901381 RepID=UPI001F341107|nr:hypothetical protein [Cytobacillus spongiae]UII55703.1 hypothetical protein LS684_19080 [Cytobacillus spongiae]